MGRPEIFAAFNPSSSFPYQTIPVGKPESPDAFEPDPDWAIAVTVHTIAAQIAKPAIRFHFIGFFPFLRMRRIQTRIWLNYSRLVQPSAAGVRGELNRTPSADVSTGTVPEKMNWSRPIGDSLPRVHYNIADRPEFAVKN
jgi:hypothetical protein